MVKLYIIYAKWRCIGRKVRRHTFTVVSFYVTEIKGHLFMAIIVTIHDNYVLLIYVYKI